MLSLIFFEVLLYFIAAPFKTQSLHGCHFKDVLMNHETIRYSDSGFLSFETVEIINCSSVSPEKSAIDTSVKMSKTNILWDPWQIPVLFFIRLHLCGVMGIASY